MPTSTTPVFTCSVPSRASRAGQAFRDTVSPTAAGQARAIAAVSPSIGPKRPSSRRDLLAQTLHQPHAHHARGDLEQLGGLERQRVGAGGGDDRLADAPDPLGEDPPARRVELGEHVVEQHERRRAAPLRDHLRLGEQEREHREPLLALRAEAAQVALAGADGDVVEVRAGAGDAALEIALEPRLERLDRRRLAGVVERRIRQSELAGALGERGREHRERVLPVLDELGAELGHLLRPRRDRLTGRGTDLDAAQRGVPLADRGRVLDRQRRAARLQAAERRGRSRRAARPGRP